MPFRLLDDEPEKLETEITPQQPTRIGRFRLLEEETEIEETPEEQSVFRQVADIPLGIARGGVTGIKMMTDILGADNPVSKSLAGVEGYMADLMSAQAKEDQQEIARIMKDAEDKGFGEQVKAGIKAFSIAPVDIMSQALGTMAPVLATGLAGGAAKLGALGIRGIQLGVGAGMGAGMIKGEIYNEVKNELINSGTPEEVAEKAAVDAQAYGGKNLDQILLGAGLGAASTLGAEGIITRILTKQGKAATAGIVSRALKGGITEAIPEGVQAAQEQLAKNVALQREGFDVDPSRGVVAAATMEAIAGAPLGGLAGAIEQPAKVKTLEEEKFEQTNEIARKVAEGGAPLTASALQDKAAANLNQDELARKLDEELSLTAIKPSGSAPVSVPTKDEYVARYSAIAQTAPEELTRAEQSFTNELAAADTEEKRINAQNALDAIKEVKTVGITPAAQPVTPVTQPPTIDATQKIIQQQGVRQEPQDGTQIQQTTEAGVSDSLLSATRSEEERQVARDIVNELQAVSNNTATREQIARLSMDGLVDVRRGQAIINEDGEGILAQSQAQLPNLTPEARAAEVEATPRPLPTDVLPAETPGAEYGREAELFDVFGNIRSKPLDIAEPIIGEEPQVSPIVGEQPTEPIISEKPATSDIVGAEPTTIVEQEPVAPTEQPAVSTPISGQPFEFFSIRNTEKSPQLGSRFGQDIEPSGKYMVESTPSASQNLDSRFEKGTVRFENPLVVEFGGGYGDSSNWKNILSSQYEGKTGIELSQAIRNAGYDGIVTVEPSKGPNRPAYTSEIVDIRSFKPKAQGVETAPAEAPAITPAPVAETPAVTEAPAAEVAPSETTLIETPATKEAIASATNVANQIEEENKVLEQQKKFSPPAAPTLQDSRSLPDAVAKKGKTLSISGGKQERNILDPNESKKKFDEIGYERQALELPEDMNDRVSGRYGNAIANIKSLSSPQWLGAHFHGGVAINPNVKGTQRGRIVAHELGHASHSLLGDKINKDQNVLNEIQAIEELLYPSLRAKVSAASNPDASFFNYLLSPNELIAEFNVERVSNPERAAQVAPALSALLESAEKMNGLVADRKAFPTFIGVIGESKERLKVKDLESRRIKEVIGDALTSKYAQWSESSKWILRWGKEGGLKNLSAAKTAFRNLRNIDKAPKSFAKRTAELTGNQELIDYVEELYPEPTITEAAPVEPVTPAPVTEQAAPAEPAGISVGNRIKLGKSPQTYTVEEVVPQSEVEKANNEQFYSVKNERTGEVQVVEKADMKQVGGKKARKMAAEVIPKQESVTPIPEANRYTFEEAVKAVDAHFGKQGIPEGVVIVNNTTEPDLEMKAGYFVNRGQIVINLAYIAKGENLGDIIDHELGHYIFGDPEFQADFKQFWELMTPEEKADADRIISQFYNKETGAIQMEEKQIRAFMQLIQDSKAMPKWRQLLDSIKRWINEKLGTNFQVTDRGALAVLAAAHKRFKSGERIIREIDSGVLKTAETAQDAEYLAAVERGDMETAQRMVDEAAKNAGYNIGPVYHKTLNNFNIFDLSKASNSSVWGPAIYASFDGDWNPASLSGGRTIKGFVGGRVLDMTKPLNETDQKILSDLLGRKIGESMPLFSLERRFGSVAQGLAKAGYSAAVHFGPGSRGLHIAVFNPSQIKSADPVTYDDAGNVIPLSQRFRTTSPDIRRMAAEPRREQVGGEEREQSKYITTPKGILAKNTDVIRQKFFDGTKVSPENTTEAWGYIERLLDIKSGNANELAGIINDTIETELQARMDADIAAGKEVDPTDDVNKRVGAAMFSVELMNYAGRLADQGDPKMLERLIRDINDMPVDNLAGGISEGARALRTRLEYDVSGFGAYTADQAGKVDRTAATLFGTGNPSKEQVNVVKEAIKASDKTEVGSAEEIAGEIENIEKRTKRKVVSKIEDQISGNIEEKRKAALEKQKARPATPSSVERQAISVIDQLARIQSDTPAFAEKQENLIKAIVQQDLRQNPDMKRKQPWTSQLTAKLIQAGVSEVQAQTISDLVWRQHEIKAMDRELKELQTAAEKGSLAVIIQRIKDTPLAMQQEPNWMQSVIRDYLVEAGLSEKAAVAAARLYESVIAERFAEAKQKAFEAAMAKSAPWKNYLSRNSQLGKNALKKIQEAIRTGVLDPTQTTEGIIAKENGWSGFSKEQLTRIVQLDDILSDDTKDQVTKAEAMHELNRIIVKAKMPVRFRDAISAYYVGQALLGIPTFAVNISSPVITALRNSSIDIAKYAVTDPKNVPVVFKSFINSIQNFYDNASFAFKSQIYMSGEVEYMQGQNVLRELFDKGVNQWNKGERAKGMANMLVGMTQITGRILSALDQGAIAMMQSQSIPRYVLAAMEGNRNIPKDKYKAIADLVLDGRRKSREYLIASGMSPDRAGVLADLQVRSEIISSLSDVGISSKDVLDASLNDALQSVGRNRAITINSLKQETKNLRDAGIISGIPIGFLENLASSASKGGQAQQVFAKMLYGFALVPARVFSTAAWFSPIGFVRLGVDSLLQKAGFESRYAMSLGNELQYKQRMFESIAGSAVMLGLYALLTPSTDDDEDKWFKIVITGNGPDYNTDPQYYDSWHKNNESSSIQLHFGKTVSKININRGGEALAIPMMFLGALDDWKIKEKQNQAKKSPEDLEMAASVIGSAFYALAQRGPWASFGKSLFDAKSGDKFVPKLFGQAAFLGKTFIPVLGTSVARNISDFINDPVDKSSIQGAIYANTPVIGPMIGTKSLNALGQPIRADDWGDKMFKLGSPLVFSFPKNTPENELNQLILKKGDGPTIPTRTNAQKKLDGPITDKEFEIYVREYGRVVSDKMFKNRKRLETMESKNYIKELDKYVNGYSIDGIKVTGASDMAVRAVKRSRNQ